MIQKDGAYQIKYRFAQRVLAAGWELVNELQSKLNVKFPPASRPGEYPHYRTRGGHDAVTLRPQTPEEVINNGMRVHVGFLKSGFYMMVLEVKRKRLGLLYTYNKMKPRLARIIGGK